MKLSHTACALVGRALGLALALVLSLGIVTPAEAQSRPVPTIDLGYVKYTGYQNTTAGINYYRGIPYAQAPVGELRWRAPVPIDRNASQASQTVNASSPGPACPQLQAASSYNATSPGPAQGVSEDCLILDIMVPSTPVSDALPVLLQIHGGGYVLGNALTSSPGDALVNASEGGIIYISIQYRLGLHGFLGGSAVAGDGDLNAGLLDQRAAIEWVQCHVRAFGGDPDQVTIWGGSAGGGSVSMQLLAGGGEGQPPFRAAIAEYPWWQPLLNASSQDTQYAAALRLSGCTNLRCLRALPSDTLADVAQQVMLQSYPGPGYGFGVYWFGPVVDGVFVRDLPDQEFKKGHFYKVPLLTDREAYEGYRFSNASQTSQVDETSDAQHLFPDAGPSFFSRLYQLYPRSAYNSTLFQRQSWFGDFIINCPTYQLATCMADRAPNASAVFKMIWAAGSEVHGATLPFLTSSFTGWPNANNHTLATIVSSYFLSFAITLDPNPLRSPDAPFWPSYVGGNGSATMTAFDVLDVTYTTIGVDTDPDMGAKCDFFSSQGWVVGN